MSKEAIVNAGQSLEDPLMRVSVKNTLCPKYTAARTQKQGDKDKLFQHCSINTGLHTSPCFYGFISCHTQRFCAVFGVNTCIKHASDQIQNTQKRCSLNWVMLFSRVVTCRTQCLVVSRRSSRSLVCVSKPSSVLRLTTFCSTESCSRSTPSNCSPPTASSTTSVSFSPPHAELDGTKGLLPVMIFTCYRIQQIIFITHLSWDLYDISASLSMQSGNL